MRDPAMTTEQMNRFLAAEFPQAFHADSGLSIEQLWHGGARVRQAYHDRFIRPGGTISGPTMMALMSTNWPSTSPRSIASQISAAPG